MAQFLKFKVLKAIKLNFKLGSFKKEISSFGYFKVCKKSQYEILELKVKKLKQLGHKVKAICSNNKNNLLHRRRAQLCSKSTYAHFMCTKFWCWMKGWKRGWMDGWILEQV